MVVATVMDGNDEQPSITMFVGYIGHCCYVIMVVAIAMGGYFLFHFYVPLLQGR